MKKKTYDINNFESQEWAEQRVLNAVKCGCLKLVIYGAVPDYRINNRYSYYQDLTDAEDLIRYGLYPVYLKYGLNIDELTRKAIEEMIENGSEREVSQAFDYIMSELSNREDYSNLPFSIVDKELMYKLKDRLKKDNSDMGKDWNPLVDPDAYFSEEYLNGGRHGYVHVPYDDEKDVMNRIMEAINNGHFVDLMIGEKEEYRVRSSDSQTSYTDMYDLINNGLYPLYLSGMHEIKKMTRNAIETMVDSGNPIALFQVYDYISKEVFVIENCCNYPFSILDKELISIIKRKRIDMGEILKYTVVDNKTVWERAEQREKMRVFSDTDAFFKEYMEQ